MWLLRLAFLASFIAAFDPSLFFRGTTPRPKLEIISPENGQILTSSDLEIVIAITGWDHPSSLFGASICVGLSSSLSTDESCFEQTHELTFHANGLLAGTAYSLRIVLFEREKAIAVSIRSFVVAGIRGVVTEGAVTIQTAVQVALNYQTAKDFTQAEKIYRSVLSVDPLYPDALHLLGLVFHEQGATETAISYIEKALQGSSTFEAYHNSLGECYRVLGRIPEAEAQFNKALALNSNYLSSSYNLGLVYQHTGQLEKAIYRYRFVAHSGAKEPDLQHLLLKSKAHECDLTNAARGDNQALRCWREGISLFPNHDSFYNEMGSTLLATSIAHYEEALESYRNASRLGNILAVINMAHAYETLGQFERSRSMYEEAIRKTESQGLSVFHIRIQHATLLPRIIESSESMAQIRHNIETKLKDLLATKIGPVDNSPPTEYGFSSLYFLVAHGENNVRIKMLLARLYIRFCPALLTGQFISTFRSSTKKLVQTEKSSILPVLAAPDDIINVKKAKDVKSSGEDYDSVPPKSDKLSAGHRRHTSIRQLKIGVVGRFLHYHPVGLLTLGVVKLLVTTGAEVLLFGVDCKRRDIVTESLIENAHGVYFAGADIASLSLLLRNASLDVIVYSEVGIDPLTYFLAFGRLAKVQMALLGHPDTTGVPNIDFFISSKVDEHSTKHFSERVVRMSGLGVPLQDFNKDYSDALISEGAQSRADFLASLQIPKNAHVYGVADSVHFLHPKFDDILFKILTADKVAHILFIDTFNATAGTGLYKERLEKCWGESYQELIRRVTFYLSEAQKDTILAIYSMHLLLDPFPVGSNYLYTLTSLSLGVPVVTFPSEKIAGQIALALYSAMDYLPADIIVDSEVEYVRGALSVAHSKKTRGKHMTALTERRHLLFDTSTVAEDWETFFASEDFQARLES